MIPSSSNFRAVRWRIAFVLFVLVTMIGLVFATHDSEPKVSIRFSGYGTNLGIGTGVVIVSNGCSFPLVRCRSPRIIFKVPAPGIVQFAPTGYSVLFPGESETILTEPNIRTGPWKLEIGICRLGEDPYGVANERASRWELALQIFKSKVRSLFRIKRTPSITWLASDWISPPE